MEYGKDGNIDDEEGYGQDINIDDEQRSYESIKDQSYVMLEACRNGNLDQVQAIVESCDSSEINDDAILVAIDGGHANIVNYLLDNGIDPNKKYREQETLVEIVIMSGKRKLDLLKILAQRGANFCLEDSNRYHAIQLAAIQSDLDVMKFIVNDNVADINDIDGNGKTALHCACSRECTNYQIVLGFLFKNKVNMAISDNNGLTALELAFENGRAMVFLDFLHLHILPSHIAGLSTPRDICDLKRGLIHLIDTPAGRQDAPYLDGHDAATSGNRPIRPSVTYQTKYGKTSAYRQSESISAAMENLPSRMRRKLQVVPVTNNQKQDFIEILLRNEDVNVFDETIRQKWKELSVWLVEDYHPLSAKIFRNLFDNCSENGMQIYSHVKSLLSGDVKYENVIHRLTKIADDTPSMTKADEAMCYPNVITPLQKSIVSIFLLTGRFKIMISILRLRQFDSIPLCLSVIMVLQNFCRNRILPKEILQHITEVQDECERICVDILNAVYLKDNTEEKLITMNFLRIRLPAYGGKSVFDLAAQSHCTMFLNLPLCRKIQSNNWYGTLAQKRALQKRVFSLLPPVGAVNLAMQSTAQPAHDEQCRPSADSTAGGVDVEIRTRRTTSNIDNVDFSFKKYKPLDSTVWYRVCHEEGQCRIVPDDHGQAQRLLQEQPTSEDFLGKFWHYFMAILAAPCTKFAYHALFHVIFLILFSFMVLRHYYNTPNVIEIFVIFFVAGYVLEELIQIKNHIGERKMKEYINDGWNLIDLGALLAFIVSVFIRSARLGINEDPLTEAEGAALYTARLFCVLSLILYFIRTLTYLQVSSSLGPKIKMMVHMLVNDLLPLLSIFLVFIIGFGVAFESLLYPNGYPTGNSTRLRVAQTASNALVRSFYTLMAADYPLEVFGDDSCEASQTCPNKEGILLITNGLLVLYVILANILLLSLLIAMFSNTIAAVDAESMKHWLSDRYYLIKDFKSRRFPPPFNIVYYVAQICLRLANLTPRKEKALDGIAGNPKTVWKFFLLQACALRGNRQYLGCKPMDVANSQRDRRFEAIEKKLDECIKRFEANQFREVRET